MTLRLARIFLPLLATCAAFATHAAITCSISSPGFAAAYDPAAVNTNITQTYFTVTCTRGATTDPGSVNYSVKVDNGLNPVGQRNRASFGANRVNYDFYKDAACGTTWKGNSAITGTITFPGTGTFTSQGDYWGCAPAAQTGLAAGTYTDSVTMTMTYGAPQSTASTAASVIISTPPTCSMTSAPGNVVFNYVSLGGAVNASTTYGVTCTLALPYTMALDATSGTIVGLNYTLALGTPASTGTGAQQTFSINGTIAAGQAGTCGTATCSGTQPRTITITY
ncbi:MAG TPA: spore coat protein U domain-containing protein [Usitatibacter sp.]|jgi:spore coat protein U-like protein|nr:spore coat protein U domain-containing protein [Usitatibacter sp.]